MRSRAKLAALKILALREEFTPQELRRAVSIAKGHSIPVPSQTRTPRNPPQKRSNPALSEAESRVVKNLRSHDPDRYSILSKIDRSMRTGEILPRLADIKHAGSYLEKNFNSGKSRKSAIPRIMAILTTLPVDQAERLYASWKKQARDGRRSETDYDEFVRFLVGSPERSSRE